ncbi:ankyrin repeat domain-containing protein [Streptomyces sp. YGL11-2]|uniref:ankyrin repeat domain-containing protein n=1 Tax=Streptomyces sp. YGL11-2 TaxID=3414028 RepID=UPI003CE9D1CA
MSDSSLPARPDLDQLRRRAKELRDAVRRGDSAALARFATHHSTAEPDTVSLAAAQFVIAREMGFPSWPALKAAVDADAGARRRELAFLSASIEARAGRAAEILLTEPGIAECSVRAAAVLGDVGAVREALTQNPAVAVEVDDERGWPPLLYACYSHWHRLDPERGAGLVEVVRLLLAARASANTNDGGRPRLYSALRGAVESVKPEVTGLLLDAGAHPDLGQPVVEAISHGDHKSLGLLLSHGARITGTWALGAAVFHDDAVAMRLLLDTLTARGQDAAGAAGEQLVEAAATASLPLIDALLDAGADPRAAGEDGTSAVRSAVRAGHSETAARLTSRGAIDDATQVDRFLGACLRAESESARRLLAEHPGLPGRLTERDRAAIHQAAADRDTAALSLMLELGFGHDARDESGEAPLHTAAYQGNAQGVRLLLAVGAEVDARDTRFEATPLAFATVGSGEQDGEPGDWIATVRLLLEAGACRRDVWVTGKPPSREVAQLLKGYGIGPEQDGGGHHGDEEPGTAPSAVTDAPAPLGDDVLSEIARHIEAACRHTDLDLLASLLHPQVHWTGLCRSSAQVLDWYRLALADGTAPTIESLEVDRGAVILGLTLTRPNEGARPAPPHRLYQVFTVDGAQIVEIRGYPDRRSALTRDY